MGASAEMRGIGGGRGGCCCGWGVDGGAVASLEAEGGRGMGGTKCIRLRFETVVKQ
jgi:hypothetical protein